MAIQHSTEPEAFSAFEHDGWAARIGGYERWLGPVTAQTVEPTLDAARVKAGTRVLDVCTGHGVLAAGAARRGAQVRGLDFAEEVVAAARGNVPWVGFDQGDAQALPYADASFDAVVCGYGLMHLPDPARALAEMRRVLSPGGRIAASSWQRTIPDTGLGMVLGAIRAHGRLDAKLPHGPDFFQFGDAAAMRAALADVGFVDIETRAVAQYLRLERPDDLLELIRRGTVRSCALLEAQDESARAAIADAVARSVEPYMRDGAYRVPMPALVGSGTISVSSS